MIDSPLSAVSASIDLIPDLKSDRQLNVHRPYHIHGRGSLPLKMVAHLILCQYGILLSQMPKDLFSVVFQNFKKDNGIFFSEKQIAQLQQMSEKIKLALQVINHQTLSKKDNNEYTPSLQSQFLEKIKMECTTILLNAGDEDSVYKALFEEKKESKEKEKFIDKDDKSLHLEMKKNSSKEILKELLNSSKNEVKTGDRSTFAAKEFSSKNERNQFNEKGCQREILDNKSISDNKEVKQKEMHQSFNLFQLAEREEYLVKLSEGQLQQKDKTSAEEKETVANMQNAFQTPKVEIKMSAFNATAFPLPYFQQDKIKTLSSKSQKFKFKKVVKKEKNPSHEKQDSDEELYYPTIDDIS